MIRSRSWTAGVARRRQRAVRWAVGPALAVGCLVATAAMIENHLQALDEQRLTVSEAFAEVRGARIRYRLVGVDQRAPPAFAPNRPASLVRTQVSARAADHRGIIGRSDRSPSSRRRAIAIRVCRLGVDDLAYSEQVEAIIRIESTLSFGAAAPELVAPAVAPVERPASSTVPVTSTLWPTCGVILLAASSSSL
jgi:hypothetical protein